MQPCIRIGSKYEGSPEQNSLRHTNKEKWICQKDFRTIGAQASLNEQEKNFVPNYVRKDPSNPPILHNFRDKPEKSKFMDSKPFRIY